MRISSRTKRLAVLITAGLLCAGLGYSGAAIADYFLSGARDTEVIEDARSVYYAAAGDSDAAGDNYASGSESEADAADDRAMGPYLALKNINPDAAGWITIPGTQIDYPVAQTDNNRYYLSHNFKKQKSGHACIFLDWRNEPGDMSFVIYGHNMKDGTFFGSLSDYEDEQYCRQHSTIDVNMWGEATQWKVFSVHAADDTAVPTMFGSFEEYEEYINTITQASEFDLGVKATGSDTILTLSTCDGGKTRLLVHAVRVK